MKRHTRIIKDHDAGKMTIFNQTHLGKGSVSFNGVELGTTEDAVIETPILTVQIQPKGLGKPGTDRLRLYPPGAR